jgi:hypothetical protein
MSTNSEQKAGPIAIIRPIEPADGCAGRPVGALGDDGGRAVAEKAGSHQVGHRVIFALNGQRT